MVIQFSSHALAETTTSNNSTFDTVTNTSSAAEINEEAYALNTAFGIECVEETPLIEKRSQMPYSLIITKNCYRLLRLDMCFFLNLLPKTKQGS